MIPGNTPRIHAGLSQTVAGRGSHPKKNQRRRNNQHPIDRPFAMSAAPSNHDLKRVKSETPTVTSSEAAWRWLMARPEDAFDIADAEIDTLLQQLDRTGGDGSALSGWPWLVRAFAQCRMMGVTPDPERVHADFQRAQRHFEAAQDRRGARLARLERAAIAMRLMDWPAALREFEALIGAFDLNALDADNFYLCFGLATAYVYMGRLEESLRFGYAGLHLARQLDLTPEIGAIAMPLGVALMAAKDPEESDAINELAIAKAMASNSAGLTKVLRSNRAVALRRMNRLDEALDEINAALAIPDPMVGGQHFLHFNAAELHLKRGDLDAARTAVDIARDLLNARGAVGLDLVKLHYIDGALARESGDIRKAIAEFAIVDRMLPDVSALRFNDRAEFYDEYAEVLARANRPGEAFEVQRKSSRQYQASLAIVNRVRRFSMQLRQEIERINAELSRASVERSRLQSVNRKLRTDIEQAIREADRLRDAASHDALTGTFNRAYLDATLPGLLTLSLQSATPLAIVMIDLDHFKRVNDRFGHAAGDAVLRRFGINARSVLRGSDLVSRYGGEEFCIVLIGCGADAARERIARLMNLVNAEKFDDIAPRLKDVSFSAGIAVYPEDGNSVEELLQASDRRLLQAKRAGRSQIVGSATSSH
jgi:diguanylate cyclase (GGDEF)-like protein